MRTEQAGVRGVWLGNGDPASRWRATLMLANFCVRLAGVACSVRVPFCCERLACRGALVLLRTYKAHASGRTGRVCMFRESCSDFAARVLEEHGWAEGVRQVRTRLSRCGGSYNLVTDTAGRTTLMYPDGLLFREDELSSTFLGRSHREWMTQSAA